MNDHYNVLTTFAGTPATTVSGGTFCEITAAAATTEFSPTVTPGKIVAAAPIHTFFLILIGVDINSFLWAGPMDDWM
jgi:hypothetical protein